MGRVMDRIDETHRTSGVRQPRNLRNGIDCADGVRRIANRHQLRLRAELALQVVKIESAIRFANVHGTNHHALFFKCFPRRIICVVIEHRKQDFVTRLELSSDRPRQSQRDRGHVLAEDHFFGRTVDQIRHRGARPGNRVVCATACEERTVGIRIRFEKIFLHGVHHLPRNLCSGRSIEKRSLLPVHLQL